MKISELKSLRNAIADYMSNRGCGCCANREGMKEAERRLAKMLCVPKYSDDSGYNFYKFRTKKKR